MFNDFLISVAAMAVVLGVMILVHEFGHFAVAKLLGVRVEQFAIGFGKRLFGFRRGDTDYRVNAIFLGGYVKMAGENPMDSHTGDPGEFTAHPRWHRFLIAVAGPAANVVLAIVLLTVVYMVRYAHPTFLDQPAVIGWVFENSPAVKADIKPGDRLIRIDGKQNPTWEDVAAKLILNPNQPLNVELLRGNEVVNTTLTPAKTDPEQYDLLASAAGVEPDQALVITQLEPNMPAADAGLRLGDVVQAVNGTLVRSMPGIIRLVQDNKEKPLTLTVERDGRQFTATVTPVPRKVDGRDMYRLGFGSYPIRVDRLPFPKAVARSLEANKRNSLLILELVERMVQRKVSMKQIAGPIGIGAAAGEAARQPGWTPLMALSALISLNLGIFNLLPIPILDGGLILLLFVEGVMRRDISQAVKERIYQAAFVFLVLIGVIVIYNDLMRTLPGLAGRLP